LKDQFIGISFLCISTVGFQRREQRCDALEKAIINDSLVLVGFDFVLALESLLVDLVLLGSNKRSLVNIRVDFDI
jgi:hypothetical protein